MPNIEAPNIIDYESARLWWINQRNWDVPLYVGHNTYLYAPAHHGDLVRPPWLCLIYYATPLIVYTPNAWIFPHHLFRTQTTMDRYRQFTPFGGYISYEHSNVRFEPPSDYQPQYRNRNHSDWQGTHRYYYLTNDVGGESVRIRRRA